MMKVQSVVSQSSAKELLHVLHLFIGKTRSTRFRETEPPSNDRWFFFPSFIPSSVDSSMICDWWWSCHSFVPKGAAAFNWNSFACCTCRQVLDIGNSVWPDWAIYCTLGYFLKPVATIILRKSLIFLAIFEKVSKSLFFLVK